MSKPDLSTLSHELLIELLERTEARARREGFEAGFEEGFEAGKTVGVVDERVRASREARMSLARQPSGDGTWVFNGDEWTNISMRAGKLGLR